MAYTAGDVKLACAALALLGEAAITSFSEPPELGATVSKIYDVTLRGLLASYPWRFTLTKTQLSLLEDAPASEWTYQHQQPADMLQLRALRTSSTPGTAPLQEYEIFGDRILSDQTELWADYQRARPPENFPPLFYALAAHALAADLAVPVTGSASLGDLHAGKAYGLPSDRGTGGLAGAARRADAQQEPPQRVTSYPLITARLGGRPR